MSNLDYNLKQGNETIPFLRNISPKKIVNSDFPIGKFISGHSLQKYCHILTFKYLFIILETETIHGAEKKFHEKKMVAFHRKILRIRRGDHKNNGNI